MNLRNFDIEIFSINGFFFFFFFLSSRFKRVDGGERHEILLKRHFYPYFLMEIGEVGYGCLMEDTSGGLNNTF